MIEHESPAQRTERYRTELAEALNTFERREEWRRARELHRDRYERFIGWLLVLFILGMVAALFLP
jgi:hypothetical protein